MNVVIGKAAIKAARKHERLKRVSEALAAKIEAKKGDLVVFPSFIDHKVAPVTKGTRYSVVVWYGGPPFK